MLNGQVAIVTGASRGIGEAIMDALAKAGAVVVGTSTSEKGAEGISNRLAQAGVSVAVTSMVPQAGPHAATRIPAVQLTTTSPENVRPVTIGLALLADIIALHPRDFAWSTYPTTANPAGEGHFERLIGVSGIREQLTTAPESVDANVLRAWTAIPGWPFPRTQSTSTSSRSPIAAVHTGITLIPTHAPDLRSIVASPAYSSSPTMKRTR